MAMLMGGPQPPPPEPVVLKAGWDAVGGHTRVVRHLACLHATCHVKVPDKFLHGTSSSAAHALVRSANSLKRMLALF